MTDHCPPHYVYETGGGWRCDGCGAVWRGWHQYRNVTAPGDVEPSPEVREEARRRTVDRLNAGDVRPDYGGVGWPTCVECGDLLDDPQATQVCARCRGVDDEEDAVDPTPLDDRRGDDRPDDPGQWRLGVDDDGQMRLEGPA